jgi:diaminobutyrate-2-oxoglutarate transaminase
MKRIFKRMESEVRGYCRSFDVVFDRAQNAIIWDENDKRHIDFLAGAGSLNYGHNPPAISQAVIEYLQRNGITHSLDLHTSAKASFLKTLDEVIFKPRGLEYKCQFTGPTGTNAVEAALKLARKVTGRQTIVSFTRGFHGVTLGSLSATANESFRDVSGMYLSGTVFMPYEGFLGEDQDSLQVLERFLEDPSSGMEIPAAVIVETVQGEGGINVASAKWLKRLENICREHEILLIVDDIQAGSGRTGSFFSFEEAGLKPDLITLSKSLGGMGLPFSLLLISPELDQWAPGEHNGTFRGNNLAFIAAEKILRTYWQDDTFSLEIDRKGDIIAATLQEVCDEFPELSFRGRGMFYGLDTQDEDLAARISARSFDEFLIVERSGPLDEVVKVMPPLTIEEDVLREGLGILKQAIRECVAEKAAEEAAKERA